MYVNTIRANDLAAILTILVVASFGPSKAAAVVTNVDTGLVFFTIQDAMDDLSTLDGHTISVGDGNYVENILINKDIILISVNGRELTNIAGTSGLGSLGAIVVAGGSAGVHVGESGHGFTILGIDNGNPGILNAALYSQGDHIDVDILDNLIVAQRSAHRQFI